MSNENTPRRYVPAVNQLVKLRLWNDYARLIREHNVEGKEGKPVHVWGYFRVLSIAGDSFTARYSPSPLDPDKDSPELFHLKLAAIDPPIGWKAQYEIQLTLDKVDMVLSWFSRGIRVKVDHALDRLAGDCFTPLDTDPAIAPTWGYALADEVKPEDCSKVFSVVAYYQDEFSMPKDKYLRRAYQKACRLSGWSLWCRNYGYHGYVWYRSKEVRVCSPDFPEPVIPQPSVLTPPLVPADILGKLEASFRDSDTAESRQKAVAAKEPIPAWILYRAGLHLSGSLEQAGNSTWMFDPRAKQDPVKRTKTRKGGK